MNQCRQQSGIPKAPVGIQYAAQGLLAGQILDDREASI